MTAHIFCWGCATDGVVNKVTATLQCTCGSTDLDLFDRSPEQLQRIAAARNAQDPGGFAGFMVEAYSNPGLVGDEIKGWDQYQGPMPGPSTMSNGESEPRRCPVCHGSGYDLKDKNVCRECGGSGVLTPTTTPEPPAVARHNYPSTQTTVPFMGKKKHAVAEIEEKYAPPQGWSPSEYTHEGKPLPMPGAPCPLCGSDPTHLVQDYKEDAWWHCPHHGPLVNIDRNPQINPYDPPEDFTPSPRSFRSAKKSLFSRTARGKSGRLLKVIASISQQNPGLYPHEVVGLARNTVQRYAEAQ